MNQMQVYKTPPSAHFEAGATVLSSQEQYKGFHTDHRNVAMHFDDGVLYIAESVPPLLRAQIIFDAEQAGKIIELRACTLRDINEMSNRLGEGGQAGEQVKRAISEIFNDCWSLDATDIHLDINGSKCTIHYRVNRDLVLRDTIDAGFAENVFRGIFYRCRPAPPAYQSFQHQVARLPGDEINAPSVVDSIRCTYAPTMSGRSLVMRVVKSQQALGSLKNMGFTAESVARLDEAKRLPKGAVLLVAPVNAGKTSTMSGMLSSRLEETGFTESGISIEDPPEIVLTGVKQVAVNPDETETRAEAFKDAFASAMRLDIDVALIGEMRGGEVADTAIRLAGSRPLFCSIHGSEALDGLPQLVKLGIDEKWAWDAGIWRYLISQRLMRTLCPNCAVEFPAWNDELRHRISRFAADCKIDVSTWVDRGEGCGACGGTGIVGLTPIVEIVKNSFEFAEVFRHKGRPAAEAYLSSAGVANLWDDALVRLSSGEIGIQDVERALGKASKANHRRRSDV